MKWRVESWAPKRVYLPSSGGFGNVFNEPGDLGPRRVCTVLLPGSRFLIFSACQLNWQCASAAPHPRSRPSFANSISHLFSFETLVSSTTYYYYHHLLFYFSHDYKKKKKSLERENFSFRYFHLTFHFFFFCPQFHWFIWIKNYD